MYCFSGENSIDYHQGNGHLNITHSKISKTPGEQIIKAYVMHQKNMRISNRSVSKSFERRKNDVQQP